MRIELLGSMGVGKTTFAEYFKEHGFTVVNEDLTDNIYLSDQYKNDDEDAAFLSQLWFCEQKRKEYEANKDVENIVYDQALRNTNAYSRRFLGLTPQCGAIENFIKGLEAVYGKPSLYIFLNPSVHAQKKRLEARNRDHEKTIEVDLLMGLQSHLLVEVQNRIWGVPVYEFDTSNATPEDYKEIVKEVLRFHNFKCQY